MKEKILAFGEALDNAVTEMKADHESLKKGFAELVGKVYTESVEFKNDIAELKNAEGAAPLDIQIIPANGVLANNREFRLIHLGKVPYFTLALPDEIPDEFKGKIIFRSSDKGCNLTVPGLTFVGDDCVDGKFVCTSSKYYEIVYENLGPRGSTPSSDKTPVILAKVTAFNL